MRALIRRWLDRLIGCTPEQIKRRRDLIGWNGQRVEVMDFEPSDQFEMPEAMGIDYVPEAKEEKEWRP